MTTDTQEGSTIIQKLCLWLATGFGFGYSPKAPGTVGAVWGIPLAWALMSNASLGVQLLVLAFLYGIGIPICTSAAKLLGKKDPGAVVWDEIVTVPIVFLFVEPSLLSRPEVLGIGFLLHRIFDISKLPPIRKFERLPDGLGIMTDDVLAGFYGCAAMHGLLFCWPWLSR